jgi:hypothetical protein
MPKPKDDSRRPARFRFYWRAIRRAAAIWEIAIMAAKGRNSRRRVIAPWNCSEAILNLFDGLRPMTAPHS